MLYELTNEEMFLVEGGNQQAYDMGHSAGKAVSAFLAAYGIYCLFAL
jgi:hypothetical protein